MHIHIHLQEFVNKLDAKNAGSQPAYTKEVTGQEFNNEVVLTSKRGTKSNEGKKSHGK